MDIGIPTSFPTLARSFRVFRIVKYVKASKQMKVLIDTIFYLLPGLFKIGGLCLLIITIFSVLGMNWFYMVKIKEPLNDYINF